MSKVILIDQDLENWVQNQRDNLVKMLLEMVCIPSENKPPNGNELPMQKYLENALKGLDFATELYALSDVDGLRTHQAFWGDRNYTDRPNLYASKKGTGEGRSLLFAVHADVVPGIPGKTAEDPFQPVIIGGRLYGRGANDMKGGTAAVLLAFQYLQEKGINLLGDLSFESVVDEEMGGANGTLAGRVRGNRADAAIIPEPTNLRVCASHMGGVAWRIAVRGKGGMGFGGEELRNPVYGMAHLIRAIESYQNDMQMRKSFVTPTGESQSPAVVLSMIQAGGFEPGMADGIPDTCMIEIWVECLPGESFAALESEFMGVIRTLSTQPELAGLEVDWELITRFIPGSSTETPLTTILLQQAEEEWGMPVGTYTAPFACDAFMFNCHSDTPAVILGPVGENAHAADEFVDIESLIKLAKIYITAIVEWCGVESGR
ncbi:N-formyl-4-amino-5-aminomethyl-2-methylpyrimidinedeformylase [Paenibacillus allorhizoplanae]|uniref:N-formyl-4-amino-5-aminomethyl-2-methylpyrimidine deformylase n=1 Tax=Paenibacillus allorhizoplanae TaxID=2905648 RepID=A0ABN8GXD6_9BACL|nr:M20/M25/M40 family metallo-hydrolase [Paenibacillus allorhizoplanae]CAH1221317.1 N-formyl-4-amino-5-aminomethyl-2-methylpyrimidinedeformylase [Paenibacillus allorhizoplanae]